MRPPREPDHYGVRPVVLGDEPLGLHDARYLARLTAFQRAAGDHLRGHATEADAAERAASLADLSVSWKYDDDADDEPPRTAVFELEIYAYEPGARLI